MNRLTTNLARLPAGFLGRGVLVAVFSGLILLFCRYPLLLLLPGLCVLLALLERKFRPTNAYGSARFANRKDLKAAGMLDGELMLGHDQPERPSFWPSLYRLFTAPPDRSFEVYRKSMAAMFGPYWDVNIPLIRAQADRNLLTVIPTGGGKGVGFLIPTLLTNSETSAVVLDPKGELYTRTAGARRWMGQDIVRIDPFGVCGQGGQRGTYNPLSLIDPDSPRAVTDAAALAQALVVRGNETESHWGDMAETIISTMILFVVRYAVPRERTLLTVREVIADNEAFTGALATAKESDAYGGALARMAGSLNHLEGRERASVLVAACRHLAWLDSTLVAASLAGDSDSFDPAQLTKAGQRKVTVYLILPPDMLSNLNRLMRVWLTGFFSRLAATPLQEERKCLFFLDEAGSLKAMPSLLQAITVLRGYGVRTWLFLQARSQLKSLFPENEDAKTALANFDTQCFAGIRDKEQAEELSAYIGDTTILVESRQASTGKSHTSPSWIGIFVDSQRHAPFSDTTQEGESTTQTQVGRRLLKTEEILNLPERSVLILAKNVPPILARMIRYYEHPKWKALAALDPEAPAKADEKRAAKERRIEVRPAPQLPAPPAEPTEGTFTVTCPNCDRGLKAPRAGAGKFGRCPSCNERIPLPALAAR
jgi:type IV secretion system protein VirD4